MAKNEPETVDRFRITAEMTKAQLGDVIAALTKLGIAEVHPELITDVMSFKKAKRFDTNGADHLREWIKEHPTFNRQQVMAYFTETGRSEESGSNAIYVLGKANEIKKLGDGNYQRADVKAIAGPKKAAPKGLNKKTGKPLARTPNPTPRYAVPHLDFILKYARGRKKFTLQALEDHFEKHGRPRKSVSPLMTALVKTHTIRHLGVGEYAVILGKPHKDAQPKLNGAAAPATTSEETTTNG